MENLYQGVVGHKVLILTFDFGKYSVDSYADMHITNIISRSAGEFLGLS